MATAVLPETRERLARTGQTWLRFCPEYVAGDGARGGYPVRWRGPFAMPRWDGVEDGEGTYVVQAQGEHIEALAFAAYGDAALWWVIAARNGLDLPDADLYPGRELRIPARAWVERVLLPQGN